MTTTVAQPDFIVGALYELPTGTIARSFGSGPNGIQYYFDDSKGGRLASHEEVKAWKHRADLNDFPNARDPILPYVFDLEWDIKFRSELVQVLTDGHPQEKAIIDAVIRNNVDLGKLPKFLAEDIENARVQAAPMTEDRFAAIGQFIAEHHLKTLKELQSIIGSNDPVVFKDAIAFKAPFLTAVLVDKAELDRLVEKLEYRMTLSPVPAATERAREALSFLDAASKTPKLRS